MKGSEKPAAAKHFSAFKLEDAADFAEKKNKAGFNVYVGGRFNPEQSRTLPRTKRAASHFPIVEFKSMKSNC